MWFEHKEDRYRREKKMTFKIWRSLLSPPRLGSGNEGPFRSQIRTDKRWKFVINCKYLETALGVTLFVFFFFFLSLLLSLFKCHFLANVVSGNCIRGWTGKWMEEEKRWGARNFFSFIEKWARLLGVGTRRTMRWTSRIAF